MSTVTIGHVENPSAKILFTQLTRTAPGQCATCGSGQDKNGFCDTQLDFEFYGRLYFCSNCVAEIAAVFGFISPVDYAEMEDEVNLSKLEKQRYIEKIDNLEEIIDGISGLKSLISSDPFKSADYLEATEPEVKSEPRVIEPESNTEQPNVEPSDSTTGKSGPVTKSVSKPGLLNI